MQHPEALKPLEEIYDFVIVGSGGGAMCAALAAQELGKTVVILEKQARVGGSTGFSGGVWWIPANPLMARENVPDSLERGRLYLDALIEHQGPGTSAARRDAFLKGGPPMVTFLEAQGMKFRRPEGWSDYYDELPGGEPRSRSLMTELFDTNELGIWADRLSLWAPGTAAPLSTDEVARLFLMKRTWAGKWMAIKFAMRVARMKLTRKRLVANGGALQGRMLQIALRRQVPIYPDTPVRDIIVENGRVVGVIVERNARLVEVRARDGVLMNVGGFSRNRAMREKYGRQPTSDQWTNANPGDTGEMIEAMMRLGAATDCLDAAWWIVTSRNVDGTWPKGAVSLQGMIFPPMHHIDLSLPHSFMVDQTGTRYCNEAASYAEVGERMYNRHEGEGKAIPSWVIFDARHRRWYNWGPSPPGVTPQEWLDTGYMRKADSLRELAEKCGIDPDGLMRTAERFEQFCRSGVDGDFNRGGRAFDRHHGDPTIKPNPNLAPVSQAPFYAVATYPGDVGTAGGVVTDEHARVLRDDGSIIAGLYATGNTTASVFGRAYPGAGASIAASFVFGFLAAHHAAGASALLDGAERRQ